MPLTAAVARSGLLVGLLAATGAVLALGTAIAGGDRRAAAAGRRLAHVVLGGTVAAGAMEWAVIGHDFSLSHVAETAHGLRRCCTRWPRRGGRSRAAGTASPRPSTTRRGAGPSASTGARLAGQPLSGTDQVLANQRALGRAVRARPDDAAPHRALGQARLDGGDLVGALKGFDAAARLDPRRRLTRLRWLDRLHGQAW